MPKAQARLQRVAFNLEAILAELDELGMQRIAIDVCMALERIRAKLAENGSETSSQERRADFNTAN